MPVESTVIDDDSPAPSKSANLRRKKRPGKEIIVISSDEEGAPTRKKNKKISELEGELKHLKQEMATAKQDQRIAVKKLKKQLNQAKQAQNEAEELVATYEEQLDEIREDTKQAQDEAETLVASYAEELEEIRERSDRRVDPAELSAHVVCQICTEPMWKPFLLPDCGHSFCQGCIQDWFETTEQNYRAQNPEYRHYQPILIPDPVRAAMANMYIEREQLTVLSKYIADTSGGPVLSCPRCRRVVKQRPVEVYALKSVVRTAAAAQGENSPGRGAGSSRDRDPWDPFFLPV